MIRFKFWLICLSIVLNVFFIGAYVAHRLSPSTGAAPGPASEMPYEALGLSARQRAAFEAERVRFHSQLLQTQEAIRSKQKELIRLLSIKNPDRAAISAQQQEILSLQDRLQNSVIAHLLEVSAPLDTMQRHHFFALLKERMTSPSSLNPPVCN